MFWMLGLRFVDFRLRFSLVISFLDEQLKGPRRPRSPAGRGADWQAAGEALLRDAWRGAGGREAGGSAARGDDSELVALAPGGAGRGSTDPATEYADENSTNDCKDDKDDRDE